jgi:ubiquinone/menaquinone biosynthesis C-methylase UbiE
MSDKIPKNVLLKESWIWPSSVTEFVKDRIVGTSINVCAGKNPLCDVNLDLDPKDPSIIKGDMRCLPFPSNTFDTVISDPPWGISYYLRFRPWFECVRIAKVGGVIIYNALWVPSCPSMDTELEEVWIRQDNSFTNVSLISIHRKVKDNAKYEDMQEAALLEKKYTLSAPKVKKRNVTKVIS